MTISNKPPPSLIQLSRSNSVALIWTFFVINALLIYLVYSQDFVFGSRSGNWEYEYFETITPIPVWIPAVILLLLAISVFVCSRLIYSREKLTLLACLLIAVFHQILLRRTFPFPLATLVQSHKANSFYAPAVSYSPVEILSQFIHLAPGFPFHAGSNMPGKILLFQFFRLFTLSPQRMGYLVILLSTLGALLLYAICKQLFGDRKVAFYAFILYTLIPAKLFFFPILNTVTPVFILLCLYLFLLYLDTKRRLFLWLLGAALYLLVLFEPSPLVTGIIFVGILLNALAINNLSKKDLWALMVIPPLGFLGLYLLFMAAFKFDLFQAFQYVLTDAVDFNVEDNRDYWIWVVENPKEFFYAAGIPIMIIFVYLTFLIFSHWKTLKRNLIGWSMEIVFILSLLVTFFVVVFLGINRGETTRLWIYLAVFFQVPAAYFFGKIARSTSLFFLVACTLVIQSIISIQRVGFVIP
jgi:hypothetical protein